MTVFTPLPPASKRQLTVAHVTHEAIDQMGGIGTVLEGLLSSPVFRAAAVRNILVGPLPHADSRPAKPLDRLGPFAQELWYSGPDHIDARGLGAVLRPIEWAFGVRIVYGTRRFGGPGSGPPTTAEVLLIDVTNPARERLAAFKWFLWEHFKVDSQKYENGWDYEEYCRLAEPAYHALSALLKPEDLPAVLISHEFMGMCTALRCAVDRARFRTVFHAHECSTARRIVEHLPGHDVAFYPAMRQAAALGQHVTDVFGDQSDFARHALISKTHLFDGVLAVGPETAEELRFLSPEMSAARLRVAYNGLPAPKIDLAGKKRSRDMLDQWLKRVLGHTPDYLITHVTRPVISKGLWRDMRLISHMEPLLRKAGKTAAYVLLTCGANPRSYADATRMHAEHNWPLDHRVGYPDLDGPETGIWKMMQHHTRPHGPTTGAPAIRSILVNQFGFTHERLGEIAPKDVTWDDLRRAADAELGMSVYEPFGIAPLEPLYAGSVCVVSTVSGCCGLVSRAMQELSLTDATCPIVLRADFTHPEGKPDVHMTAHQREHVEEQVCARLAAQLVERLPRSDTDRQRYIDLGQRLAQRMSWDRVSETDILPGLYDAVAAGGMGGASPGGTASKSA